MYGNVLTQLIQLYVQISYSTTLPFISFFNSSGVVFRYSAIPTKSGAFLNPDLSISESEFTSVNVVDDCTS